MMREARSDELVTLTRSRHEALAIDDGHLRQSFREHGSSVKLASQSPLTCPSLARSHVTSHQEAGVTSTTPEKHHAVVAFVQRIAAR